jgi:hypothetical protein
MSDLAPCFKCDRPIEPEKPVFIIERATGEKKPWHPGCWGQFEITRMRERENAKLCVNCGGPREDAEQRNCTECRTRFDRQREEQAELDRQRRQAIEDRQRLRSFDQSFAESCVGSSALIRPNQLDLNRAMSWDVEGCEIGAHGPLSFPRWSYARHDNQEFCRRTSSGIRKDVLAWDPPRDGSIVIAGPTGRGKSSWLVAWVWREHDARRARVIAGEKLRFHFAWVSGYELSGARKRCKLGDESPIVELAMQIPLLFLDEVGTEPPSEEIFAVLDARYRAELPTALTSPLEPMALATTIGGGAYRRLLERGVLVDVHGERAADPKLRSVR